MANTEHFDIPLIRDHLQNCLLGDDDVSIEFYLEAYKELIKFCELIGGIFSFVKEEIESKSTILQELKSEHPENFTTLKTMVNYEKESELLKKSDYVSGCRTLLRLHWGFDFIRNFLDKVRNLGPQEYTSTVGSEVYKNTLSRHHVWYVRLGARYAISSLPIKQVMVEKLWGENPSDSIHEELLPSMLEAANEVYNRTEAIYRLHGLLELQ